MVKKRLSLLSKRNSILIYCEGEECKAFVQYLKSQFFQRAHNYNIKINYVDGNANRLLQKLSKQPFNFQEYDLIITIYDLDIGAEFDYKLKEKCQKLYRQKKIRFIENKPCLEAFLLQILEGKNYSNYSDCGSLKTRFEHNYVGRKRRTNPNSYAKHFPKSLLTHRAQHIPDLQLLLDVISGKV